jgi:hypothetical protein
MSANAYSTLADVVLLAHVGFVVFIIVGLLAILCGGLAGWRWIRHPWFRAGHLAGIGWVVVQAWLGVICPLTTWEQTLRAQAGDATYAGTFIAHWLQAGLYFDAPAWVFTVCYTLFGLAVIGSWLKFRPRPFRAARPPAE